MITSKRNFDKAVEKRARQLARQQLGEHAIAQHEQRIQRVENRINRIDKTYKRLAAYLERIEALTQKNSIHGFYATPEEVTIVRKEGKDETE